MTTKVVNAQQIVERLKNGLLGERKIKIKITRKTEEIFKSKMYAEAVCRKKLGSKLKKWIHDSCG